MRILLLIGFLVPLVSIAANHVPLSGKVVDLSGRPIEHATVLIYHAGVKQGYSTFCPSCYSDCGKRAITNADGTFVIPGVDADLLFKLLAVRNGFEPVFVANVDPLSTLRPLAKLLPAVQQISPENVVRGRVVDDHNRPLRDAVITPVGVSAMGSDGGEGSTYGEVKGLEPLAVTDENGNFAVSYNKPAFGMLLKIEARGFSPDLQAVTTGADRKTITVSPGAVIRGRLIDHGQPVAGAEVGLVPRDRGGFGGKLKIIGHPYDEIRVGTQPDGSFVLADVPASVDWYLYAKMESVSTRGATEPVECKSRLGGEIIDVGDVKLTTGHRFAGRLVLPNGAPMPHGMRIFISTSRALDSQTVLIRPDGAFSFMGLPTDTYSIVPSVQGFYPSDQLSALGELSEVIDRDIDNFEIILQPDTRR
jgi:protocatechuate 3,4-dioxygenase beta subunit